MDVSTIEQAMEYCSSNVERDEASRKTRIRYKKSESEQESVLNYKQ